MFSNGEIFYKQYVDGDDRAFEEVVKIYYDGLVAFITSYTHSSFESEDIANDCFLYIAIHKHKYNFNNSLKTYLYTLGRSRALNFLKKRKRLTHDNIEDYPFLSNCDYNSEILLEESEKRLKIATAISELKGDMQSVVYLFYFENMSYEEIAKVLKIKIKQVDNYLYRAKKILQEKLKKEVDEYV